MLPVTFMLALVGTQLPHAADRQVTGGRLGWRGEKDKPALSEPGFGE